MLVHTANLNKTRRTETALCSLFDYKAITLKINSKEFPNNYSNSWRINNTLLNNEGVKEKKRKKYKKFLELNDTKNTSKLLGLLRRKIYRHSSCIKKIKKHTNKWLNDAAIIWKNKGKNQTPKMGRCNKFRARISDIEARKHYKE